MSTFSLQTTLPVVRTHVIDERTAETVGKLKNVFLREPLIVLHSSAPTPDNVGFHIVDISLDHVRRWGIENSREDWAWFCGDFCYYRAQEQGIEFSHCLLIEHDVFFLEETLRYMISQIGEGRQFHAAAAQLTDQHAQPPRFSRDLSVLGLAHSVGCIFPVSIASADQIARMKRLRLAADAQNARLNDEAIFASCAFEHPGSLINLSDEVSEVFSRSTFYTNPPHLYEGLIGSERQVFWHPVVTQETVLKRIESGEKNYTHHRLRRVLREAPVEIRKRIFDKLNSKPGEEGVVAEAETLHTVVANIDGVRISFTYRNPKDEIQKYHHAGEFYEREELQIIQRNFHTGFRYLDIGANVGNHAIFVGKYLEPSSITLIEPNPDAASLLILNILRNNLLGIANIENLQIGLSDSSSNSASITASRRNLGGGKLKSDGAGQIRVERGDDIFEGKEFDFIKIDVEGMEVAVLNGIINLINRCRPIIFIEVDNENTFDFLEWVRGFGYEVCEEFQRYKSNNNYLIKPANPAN